MSFVAEKVAHWVGRQTFETDGGSIRGGGYRITSINSPAGIFDVTPIRGDYSVVELLFQVVSGMRKRRFDEPSLHIWEFRSRFDRNCCKTRGLSLETV